MSTSFNVFFVGEYDQKRLMATKALQNKPSAGQPRLPNATWSGLGFSSSMPESSIRGQFGKEVSKQPLQQVKSDVLWSNYRQDFK